MAARVIEHPASASIISTPYSPDPVLLAIVQTIREGLMCDQHVRLHNFGTFRLRMTKARRVKHPKTGKYVVVPPSPRITFTPAKHLREAIDPDKKPAMPLQESAHTQLDSAKIIEATITGKKNQHQDDERNLNETIQDIIDEEFTTSVTENDEPNNALGKSINKKWAIGLLASVPLILVMLQADFSADDANTTTTKTATEFRDSHKAVSRSAPPINQVIRTIPAAPNTQNTTLPEKTSRSIATARPEPKPKSFHMSPQIHTIEQGDSLWSLAEIFYGDALLWPHIYRANLRTLSDPDIIITGQPLIIPGLQEPPERLSENDQKLVSEGYYKVYQFNKNRNDAESVYFLVGAKQYSFDWLKQNKQHIEPSDWQRMLTLSP